MGFLDSSGLNELLRLRWRVADAGGSLVLAGVGRLDWIQYLPHAGAIEVRDIGWAG